jgi:hypothetical protein
MTIFPTCREYAENLILEITKPNSNSHWGDGLRQMGQQINGSLPPLYLQWKGHSITIVGIQKVVTALMREFESKLNDIMITEQYTPHPKLMSSGGNTNNTNWPVLELPANKLIQKDCQILLSTARVKV